MKVTLTKDIEKYRSKAFLGLNARQICFVLVGLAAGAGIYALSAAAPLAVRTVAAVAVGMPIALMGMLTYGGMSAFQLLKSAVKGGRYKYEDDEGDFLNEKES